MEEMQPLQGYLDDSILDTLVDLQKISSSDSEPAKLNSIIGDWINYSQLISWISLELKAIQTDVEETLNPIKNINDLREFRIELSSLLNELGCPYSSVMSPQATADRFESPENKKLVLYFLLSELQACRMIHINQTSKKGLKVELNESSTAKLLKEICLHFSIEKPPDNLTAQQFWTNLINKAKSSTGSTILEPLFDGLLSSNQWSLLEKYFSEFESDYSMRREMLLKRLDVTVQSFHWSDRLKGEKEEKLNQEFQKIRPMLKSHPDVQISDVLAARADLAIVEKTSSTSVRKNTRSAVNEVVIGRVPDRGGRANEIVPPPPEMPSWQTRKGGPPSAASGWIQNPNQRGGRPPRGGRVQGGWSGMPPGQGSYQQTQGGYQQQQQNYQASNYQQGQGYQGGAQRGDRGGNYYQQDQRGVENFQDQWDNNQHQGRGGGYQRNYDDRDNRGGGRGGRGRTRRY